MSNDEISAAEKALLDWLRAADSPVSRRDLLRREPPEGVSPLGVRSALWNLVDRGAARETADHRLEPTER
ncbi:MAG TPA: hypothetical protein VF541_14470 [Longimicrobium sp.]